MCEEFRLPSRLTSLGNQGAVAATYGDVVLPVSNAVSLFAIPERNFSHNQQQNYAENLLEVRKRLLLF